MEYTGETDSTEASMRFDAPQGSMFGGYGFLNYSARPASGPSAAHRAPSAAGATPGFSVRTLLRSTGALLRRLAGR
jgi:hypothetical protein